MQKLAIILYWFFGLFCLVVGAGNLINVYLIAAALFFGAAALLLPPVRARVGMITGRTLPWPLRVGLVVAILLLAGFIGKR